MATANRSPAPVPLFRDSWQVPVFVLGLTALLGVWLTHPLWYDPDARRFDHALTQARRVLDDPHASVNGLTLLLTEALGQLERFPERAGETHFLLGSAYLRLAGQMPADRAPEAYRQARLHLEQAEALGVRRPERPRLLYRLGKANYHTGANPQRVIDYLIQCIDQMEEERGEAYGMLAESYLRLPTPDLRAALDANDRQLQMPVQDEGLLAPARLLRGELLLREKDREGARKVLARIGPGAPPGILAQARLLRAQCFQEDGTWAEAAKLWEEAINDRREPTVHPGRTLVYLGLCYRNLNRPADAARAWEKAAALSGEEAQAAQLYLADLRLRSGDVQAALVLYRRAFTDVMKPADYHNGLLGLAEACSLMESASRSCTDAARYEAGAELAGLNARLAAAGPAQALLAQVAEAWGKARRERARQLTRADESRREEDAAREHLRLAGAAFEVAADATADQAGRAEFLWRAGDDYVASGEYARAVFVLEEFVKLRPAAEQRMSEAWFRLGQVHQALHNSTAAASSFLKSIEYGGTFAFRARYQLAQSLIDQGKLADAEDVLVQILELNKLDVDPVAYEQALYALANLLFREEKLHNAAHYAELATNQYPKNPEAAATRFRLGECFARQAEQELSNLRLGEAMDTRPFYQRQSKYALEKAGANFQKVIDDLEILRAAGPLTDADADLLLRASFALAECRFKQGLYEEAVRLYTDLAGRYQQRVEGLVALQHLWLCQILPYQPPLAKARETMQRAHAVLDGLDDSAFRGRPEAQSRDAWERWLKAAEEQLRQADGVTRPASPPARASAASEPKPSPP
jgi:tetratricopeptide (TPR) repeat protein